METITEKQNNAAKVENKDFGFIDAMTTDGTPIKVAKSTILEMINEEVYKNPVSKDGVYIMYHNERNSVILANLSDWPAIQDSGRIADGVAIVTHLGIFVVAPTEASTLKWSSQDISAGGTTTNSKTDARIDYKGMESTQKQIANVACQGASNAAGYCATYSRGGVEAGKWWLPSVGELSFLADHFSKINYALSLIQGATLLARGGYWASTEANAKSAWILILANHGLYSDGKTTGKGAVRPICAFSDY